MSNIFKYILLTFVYLLLIKADTLALSFTGFIEKDNAVYLPLEQSSEESNNQQTEEDLEDERPIEDDWAGILSSFYQINAYNKSVYLIYQTDMIIAHISLHYPPPDCR